MSRFSNIVFCVFIVIISMVAGCEQGYEEEAGARHGVADAGLIVPDYASRAIEAAGGRRAWMKTKEFVVDGVVTFYQLDGIFYLTERHYKIHPWLNSIEISAQEPPGELVWVLSPDGFRVLKGAEKLAALPNKVVFERWFAEAVLNLTTAPVRFLDKSVKFEKLAEPVKIEGRWYYPIERAGPLGHGSSAEKAIEPYWSHVVFYQDSERFLVDVIWFADFDRERFLAARGYDYHEVEEGGVLVPAKIEVIKTNARGELGERLVKVDFK